MRTLALLLALMLLLCVPAFAQEEIPQLTLNFAGQGDDAVTFAAQWCDTDTARALAALLPQTLLFSDLNGYEKYAYLDVELPECGEAVETIHAGDILLFGNQCLVIFYEDTETPYNYTRIGQVLNIDALKTAMGDWEVTFTLITE